MFCSHGCWARSRIGQTNVSHPRDVTFTGRCKTCQAEIVGGKVRILKRLYCSRACYSVSRITRPEMTSCLYCGLAITRAATSGTGAVRTFCSYRCAKLARTEPIGTRLWGRVEKTATCWLWTGVTNTKGYGLIGHQGKYVSTHRLAWVLTNGEILDNLHVLHKCDTPNCVRPEHLFLGTNLQNQQDRKAKRDRDRAHYLLTHSPA